MTFEEMTQQIEQLTLDEQLRLLEMLSGRIRKRLKASDDKAANGSAMIDDEAPTLDEIREGIKEGLREAMRGEGVPISQLLAELDDE